MGEVRGAVVDTAANRWVGDESRREATTHEWCVFDTELGRVGADPAIQSIAFTLLPEDATHKSAGMRTPDFVIQTGTNRFEVIDAKQFSVGRDVNVGAKADEIEKGMQQVNETAFLPHGAQRTAWLAVAIKSSGTDTAIVESTGAAARAAAERLPEKLPPTWIDVDVRVYRSGGTHDLAHLRQSKDYRP